MSLFILAKTVLRNLFSRPATRRHPFVVRAYYKNTRGKITNVISECIFCGICQRKCPTSAITVNRPEKKWTINRLRCTACGSCVEHCPKKCLIMENQYSEVCVSKTEDTYHA